MSKARSGTYGWTGPVGSEGSAALPSGVVEASESVNRCIALRAVDGLCGGPLAAVGASKFWMRSLSTFEAAPARAIHKTKARIPDSKAFPPQVGVVQDFGAFARSSYVRACVRARARARVGVRACARARASRCLWWVCRCVHSVCTHTCVCVHVPVPLCV